MLKQIISNHASTPVEFHKGSKTNIRIAKGEFLRVLDVRPNESISAGNVLVIKQGKRLTLKFADDSELTIDNFYEACADGACRITVAGKAATGHAIDGAPAKGVALADGSELIYAHGEQSSLLAMAIGNQALTSAISAKAGSGSGVITYTASDTYTPSPTVLWGIASAAGLALASSKGSGKEQPPPAPQLATLSGKFVAGPIINAAELTVELYDSNGTLIGSSPLRTDGTYQLTLTREYSGQVLLKLMDAGNGLDYMDEATRQATDLSQNVLWSTGFVMAGQKSTLYVSLLTDKAVRLLNQQSRPSGPISEMDLKAASQNALESFGFEPQAFNVFTDEPIAVVTSAGTLQAGNAYGVALAALSAYEASGKTTTELLQSAPTDSLKLDIFNAVLNQWANVPQAQNTPLVADVLGLMVSTFVDKSTIDVVLKHIHDTGGISTLEQLKVLTDTTAPVVATSFSVDENTPLDSTLRSISLTASKAVTWSLIKEGDAASFILETGDKAGTLRFITTANHESQSDYHLTVEAQDTAGNVTRQSIEVHVNNINEAPSAASTALTFLEDTRLVLRLDDFGFSDASDRPANALQAVIISELPATGKLKLGHMAVAIGQIISRADIPSGALVFEPDPDTNGAPYARMGFKVQDDGGTLDGGCDTSEEFFLTLDVIAVNDSPILIGTLPTFKAVDEDSSNATATRLGLDGVRYSAGGGADELAQTLTFIITGVPDFLTLFTADGTPVAVNAHLTESEFQGLTYKTLADANGTGHLTWAVKDNGQGVNDTLTGQQLSLTVTPVNDAPALIGTLPTFSAVNEDSSNVTATNLGLGGMRYGAGGGSDELAQTLTILITGIPAFLNLYTADGTPVVVNAELTESAFQGLTYKTLANANGTGDLTWTVKDNGQGASNTLPDQRLTVAVISVNDAPTASDVALTVDEDCDLVLTAEAFGFADDADSSGDVLNAVIISRLPDAGTLKLNQLEVTTGQRISLPDIQNGKLVFKGAQDACGMDYANIGFKVQDTGGTAHEGTDTSTEYTLTVNVSPVNDAPTGGITITGPLRQGDTLRMDTSTVMDIDGLGAFHYRWYADGVEIAGATESTFTLTQDQVGKRITAQLQFTDGVGTLNTFQATAAGGTSPDVISLGQGNGQLIGQASADGGQRYYYWDRNGDGLANDTATMTELKQIFNRNSAFTSTGSDINSTFHYAEIGGVRLELSSATGAFGPRMGTAINGSALNPTYDGLLAVWDAFNGTNTTAGDNGTPANWSNGYYWIASGDMGGGTYSVFRLLDGYKNTVYATSSLNVALRLLPSSSVYSAPSGVVEDVNDAPIPSGTLAAIHLQLGEPLSLATQSAFLDPDSGYWGRLRYQLDEVSLSNGFTIDAITGVIQHPGFWVAQQARYCVLITAVDSEGIGATQALTVELSAPAAPVLTEVKNLSGTSLDFSLGKVALTQSLTLRYDLSATGSHAGDVLQLVSGSVLFGSGRILSDNDITLGYVDVALTNLDPDATYKLSGFISYGARFLGQTSQSLTLEGRTPIIRTIRMVEVQDMTGPGTGVITAGSVNDESMPSVLVEFSGRPAADDRFECYLNGAQIQGQWTVRDKSGTSWLFKPANAFEDGEQALKFDWVSSDGERISSDVFSYVLRSPVAPVAMASIQSVTDDNFAVSGARFSGVFLSDQTIQIKGTLTQALGSQEFLYLYDGVKLLGKPTLSASGLEWFFNTTSWQMNTGAHRLMARVENPVTAFSSDWSNVFAVNEIGALKWGISNATPVWYGRYVMVRVDSDIAASDSSWNPSEIRIYSDATLISQGATVTANVSNPGRLVDGVTDTWLEILRTHWLQVDLGARYSITSIDLFGRANRADRLKGSIVFISDNSMSSLSLASLKAGGAVTYVGAVQSDAVQYGFSNVTANALQIKSLDQWVISGTFETNPPPDGVVRIYHGADLLATTPVTGKNWSAALSSTPNIPNGSHTLTARLESLDGRNTYATSSQLVEVNVPMATRTVRIESVLDDVGSVTGSVVRDASTDDTTPQLTVRTSAKLSDGDRLQVSDGSNPVQGTWLALDQTGTLWQFTPSTPLTAGTPTWNVRWLNAAGTTLSTSDRWGLSVSPAAAALANTTTLSMSDDVGAQQGVVLSGLSSDDSTLKLNGQLDVSLAQGEVLRIYDGITPIATVTPNATGAWVYTTSGLGLGLHHLQARVEQTSTGLVGAFSVGGLVNLIDIPRVVVNGASAQWVGRFVLIRGDAPNLAFFDGNWNPAEVMVYDSNGRLISTGKAATGVANAGEMNDGSPASWLELARSGSWIQIDLGAVYELSRVTVLGRSDRPDRLQGTMVFASDFDMSNLDLRALQAGVSDVFSLGTVAGRITTSTFYAPATVWLTRDQTPTISGDISAALLPDERLAVYESGALLGRAQINGASWSFTLPDSKALATGSHAISVQLESANGTVLWSKLLTVNVDTNPLPALSSVALVDDTGILTGSLLDQDFSTDDGTPLLKGVLQKSLPSGSDLVISSNGQRIGRVSNFTRQSDGGMAWEYPLSLPAGSYELSIAINDLTSASTRTLDTRRFSVLSVNAPTWIEAEGQGQLPRGVATTDTGLSFNGLFASALRSDEHLQIYVDDRLLGEATPGANGRWSYALPDLQDGTHRLFWRVVKMNQGTTTLIQGADVALQTSQTLADAQIRFNALQQNAGWVFEGKATPYSQIVVKWGAVFNDTVTVDANGSWKTTFYANNSRFGRQAPNGIHDVFVYERDIVSGVLTEVGHFEAQLDTLAPQLLSMQSEVAQVVAGQVVRLHLHFSEAPYQLDINDFDVTGGSLHNLVMDGSQVLLDLLIASDAAAQLVVVNLKSGAWTDRAGNPGIQDGSHVTALRLEKLSTDFSVAQHVLHPLTGQFVLRAGAGMALDLRDGLTDVSSNAWSVLIALPAHIRLSHGTWDTAADAWRVSGEDLHALKIYSDTSVADNVLLKITYQTRASATSAWQTWSKASVIGQYLPYIGAAGSSEDFQNFTHVREAWNDGLQAYSGAGILINILEGNGALVPSPSDFNLGNLLDTTGTDWASDHSYGVGQRAAGSLNGNFRGAAYNALLTWINGNPLPGTDIINRSVGAGSTFGLGWFNSNNGLYLRNGLGAVVINSIGNDGRPLASERMSSKAEDVMAVGSLNNELGNPIYDYGDDKHISVPGWGGTSHASPLAAGLSALILEANPSLGFRDVQAIIAYAARYLPTTGGGVSNFKLNSASTLNGVGLHYSFYAGFGVFDAQAAVALARDWLTPSGYRAKTAITDMADPQSVWKHSYASTDTASRTVSPQAYSVTQLTLAVLDDVSIESVRFKVNMSAAELGQMQIVLISPNGTDSVLMTATSIASYTGLMELTSRRFWGESSRGVWTAKIYNNATVTNSATVDSMQLDLFGVKDEVDHRYIYTDEWSTTYNNLANASTRERMNWLSDQDGGNDGVYLSAVSTDVLVILGHGGHIDLDGHRIGLLNGASIRNVFGGRGDDCLIGPTTGHAIIAGNDGSDKLVAIGSGNILDGQAGADTIWFSDADTVSGGEGADKFVITRGEWAIHRPADVNSLIQDFDPGADRLFRYDPFLHAYDMLVTYGDEDLVTWTNVKDASLLIDFDSLRDRTSPVDILGIDATGSAITVKFNQQVLTANHQCTVNGIDAVFSLSDDHTQLNVASHSGLTTIQLERVDAQLLSNWGNAFKFGTIYYANTSCPSIDASSNLNPVYLWGSANNVRLTGGYGNDALVTLDPNGGDILTGGGGADLFAWRPQGRIEAGITQVLDFNRSEGDTLDISDILVSIHAGSDLSNHVKLTLKDGDALLEFDLNGNGLFSHVYAIQLVGAALNNSIGVADDLASLSRHGVFVL